MKKWLIIIGLVLPLVREGIQIIKELELPGWGAEKKETVMRLLEEAFKVAVHFLDDKIDVTWDEIKGTISTAIDVVVTFFNTVNIFKKDT